MTKSNGDRDDGRDSKGCWVKGVSGNLSGRPENVPDLKMSDVRNFANEPMEIVVGGEKLLMTRHEVVLLKMFQAAMNGSITALKYLLEKFEQAEFSAEYIELWLQKWAYIIDNEPESVPPEIPQMLIRGLQVRKKPLSPIRRRPPGKRNR